MLNVDPRQYQEKAINFLVKQGKGLVRARTGAGKTIMGLGVAEQVEYRRCLIVCPRSAQWKWANEIADRGISSPETVHVMDKESAQERAEVYESSTVLTKYVIIRYGQLLRDVDLLVKDKTQFDFVIFDEAHKLRNHQTKTFKAARKLARKIRRKYFFTATDQSKGPQNLWTVLHLLNPSAYSSYWKFVNRYCVTDEGGYGVDILGVRKSTVSELRTRLRGYVHYIKDDVVKEYVPEVIRQKLPCVPDRKTMKVYRKLEKEMIAELPDGDMLVSSTSVTTQIRLRQLLVCPKLIHEGLPYGSGIDMIGEHAWDNEDAHIVVFCPFTQAFPFLEDRLRAKWKFKHFYTIKGGMNAKDIVLQADQWSRHANQREEVGSVLLCSIKAAESFDLFTALNGYFLHYEWNFEWNEQAEGRMARGDKPFANAHYITHNNTVDTQMLDVLNLNKRITGATFKDFDNLAA